MDTARRSVRLLAPHQCQDASEKEEVCAEGHCLVSLQDVLRNWYARLPTVVETASALVSNAEECAQALKQGTHT